MAVDPLTDLMPEHSGYNYVFNNPISLIDPFGLSPDTARVRPVPGQPDTYEPIDPEDNMPVVDVRPNGGSSSSSGLWSESGETGTTVERKWKVEGAYLTEEQFFELARQHDFIAHRVLRQEFGEQHAIDFMKYDVASAISDANDVGITVFEAVAPVPKVGLALKLGGSLMATTGMIKVSKKAFGLRVGLGGSKKALLSTVLAYKLGLRGSLGRKVPTFIGPRASSLETALGRNAIPIGGSAVGAGFLIDELNKKE